MNSNCSFCKAPLAPAASGFYFCEACKAPYFSGNTNSPFAVFGLSETYDVDLLTLEETYFSLSRRLHPDRFAMAEGGLRAHVQSLSAVLNQAYLTLKSADARLEALLELKGFVTKTEATESKKQIPMELAEEFFEIQELLLDRPEEALARIRKFKQDLEAKEKILSTEIRTAALDMDWKNVNTAVVEKILSARKTRSYLRSMQENLARIGGLSHV